MEYFEKSTLKKTKNPTLNGRISKTRTNLKSNPWFFEGSFNFLYNRVIFCSLYLVGYKAGAFATWNPWRHCERFAGLKELRTMQVKSCCVKCKLLKTWNFSSFLICFLILVFMWRHVLSIQLELKSAQLNVCTRKDFKSSVIGSLYIKKIFWILNELKINVKKFNVKFFITKFFAKLYFILIWPETLLVCANWK